MHPRIFPTMAVLYFLTGPVSAEPLCQPSSKLPELEGSVALLSDAVPPDQRFESLKADYLGSGMCDPLFNYPDDLRLGLLFKSIDRSLDQCTYQRSFSRKGIDWPMIQKDLDLGPKEISQFDELFAQCKKAWSGGPYEKMVEAQDRLRFRLLGTARQKFLASGGNSGKKLIHQAMVDLHMMSADAGGAPDCKNEFISQDAFNQAMSSYEALRKQGKLTNPRFLTVADYSKPSNSRRMYVIDLYTNRVVDQTWVAHGMGSNGREAKGQDGFGSNPKFSNIDKSLFSSSGAMLTKGLYEGDYGESLILTGTDEKNSNVERRHIVIHDWEHQNLMPTDPKKFSNALKSFEATSNPTPKQVSKIMSGLVDWETFDFLMSTEGCLGIRPGMTRVRDTDGTPKMVPSGSSYLRNLIKGGSLVYSYSR